MKREYDFSRGKRGPVLKPAPGKSRITIRLDNEVLDWFRAQAHAAGGGNYQSLINAALVEHVTRRPRSPRWRWCTIVHTIRDARAKGDPPGVRGGPEAGDEARNTISAAESAAPF